MIDAPRVVVRVSPDRELVVRYGPRARRIAEIAQTWSRRCLQQKQPPVYIDTLSEVDPHVGLGSGTQLALALATALHHCFAIPTPPAATLARSVDRGHRSAVGTHGFLRGGLIVEAGRTSDESLSELVYHMELPTDWRFLLVRVAGQAGRSGVSEQQAFARMPPVPPEVRERLWQLLEHFMVPSIARSDLEAFGQYVYEYGVLSGESFASEQWGRFADGTVAQLVSTIRELGVQGVGQSSWGPTVFAILSSESSAREVQSQLLHCFRHTDLETQIVRPDNRGAHVKIL